MILATWWRLAAYRSPNMDWNAVGRTAEATVRSSASHLNRQPTFQMRHVLTGSRRSAHPTAEPIFGFTLGYVSCSQSRRLSHAMTMVTINSVASIKLSRRRSEMEAAVTTVLADAFRLTAWDVFGDR